MNKLVWLSLTSVLVFAASENARVRDTSSIERGKYIVEGVAMCGRCHTPHNEKREPERMHWLMGAPIQKEPTYPERNWAVRAPRIAGSPPGTDDQFITLMTTGISRTGMPPKPPMPSFRMTTNDAEAVLAYLKSVHQ
jgi:hypothetical protein